MAGTETRFLHAGDMEIAEYNAAGTLLRRYIPGGAIDARVAWIEGSGTSASAIRYYHADRLGNVVALTDSNMEVDTRYAHDPFGNETTGASASGNLFRYTGRKLDPETGLYYYRARYYDPELGRFLQTDPVGYGDQFNLYAYVANDPVNGTDPSGACTTGTRTSGRGNASGCRVAYQSGGRGNDSATACEYCAGGASSSSDPDRQTGPTAKAAKVASRKISTHSTNRSMDTSARKIEVVAVVAASPALLLALPEVAAAEGGIALGNAAWQTGRAIARWWKANKTLETGEEAFSQIRAEVGEGGAVRLIRAPRLPKENDPELGKSGKLLSELNKIMESATFEEFIEQPVPPQVPPPPGGG